MSAAWGPHSWGPRGCHQAEEHGELFGIQHPESKVRAGVPREGAEMLLVPTLHGGHGQDGRHSTMAGP